MLIYSPHITQRLNYTVSWIFGMQYGIAFRFTRDINELLAEKGPRLNYSEKPVETIPQMLPAPLLFETEIRAQSIPLTQYKNLPAPFANGDNLLGFDLFAAVFYCISRYEEYLGFEPDAYGRFPAANSLLQRLGVLQKPVVDLWLAAFRETLQLETAPRSFRSLFTYDIDTAYAYRGRPFWLTAAHWLKDGFTGRFARVRERWRVLTGREPDPYDTYAAIRETTTQRKLPAIFFFLLGERNRYNRNLQWNCALQKALVNQVKDFAGTGIHPSYYSSENPALLRKEKLRLQMLTQQPVLNSRQHYLRFSLPQTYRQLAEAGIRNDYSMGFAETPGFRAGTCNPFTFFDLEKNEGTPLTIFPVTFMEGSFAEDMQLTPEAALPVMENLVQEVKNVNGFFCCIWHNHTLSNHGFWKGWKAVHDRIAELCAL